MLDSLLQALARYEPTISSIVGLLTLCAAIWGILQLTISARKRSGSDAEPTLASHDSRAEHQTNRPPNKQRSWKLLLNLGLSEHSQLEELVSVRTVNVVFFCLLALSFPWLLVSVLTVETVALTVINLLVFVSALLGFALQRAGATFGARWLLIFITAIYWLGAILAVGPGHGTEYFLAGLLALPVLVFNRAQTGQILLSIILLIAVFSLGIGLTQFGSFTLAFDETFLTIGYYSNAIFLAAIIFAVLSYYKGFAASSYQMLASQKQRNDALVAKLFPPDIAQQMVNQEDASAQWHPDATVLFAKITGFTQLYSRMPAIELVAKLEQLYSRFDELLDVHEIEKVKTLGTTYVAATGIDSSTNNCPAVASCSLAMNGVVAEFARDNNLAIGFRCGIATGVTISGVIGKSRPRFDIWGEALESAGVLQASAEDGEILVNQTANWRLNDHFDLESLERDGTILKLRSEHDEHE